MAGGMCGRWQGVHGKGGTCMVWGSMCGGGGHAWQGGSVCGREACMAEGHAWQERRPLQQTVRILLECILVRNVSLIVDETVQSPVHNV